MISTDRIPTRIRGFDEMVQGGLLRGSLNIVSGSCGTGKSIFCGHFIYEGAKNGEAGAYISLEDEPETILNQWNMFGWDTDKLIKNKTLFVTHPQIDYLRQQQLLELIQEIVTKNKVKRLVFDSITLFGLYSREAVQIRDLISRLARLFKQLDCTVLAVSEVEEGSDKVSSYGLEEYVADGVILLRYVPKNGEYNRAITVRKMRATNHSKKICQMDINSKGISVFPNKILK